MHSLRGSITLPLFLGLALKLHAFWSPVEARSGIIQKMVSSADSITQPAVLVVRAGGGGGGDDEKGENQQRNHRAIAKQPLGTFLFDQLRLLSPFTWLGIVKIKPDVNWQWKKFFQGMAGIMLPIIGYYGLLVGPKAFRNELSTTGGNSTLITEIGNLITKQQHINFLIPFMPWSIFCFWKGTEGIRSVARAVWDVSWFSGKQSYANPDAWQTLSERISSGRAHRSRRYDIYLPPSDRKGSSSSIVSQEAIIFLPGFGVEHSAYAGPAALLSDAGYVVVVVSAEPLRGASPKLGCTPNAIRRIQRHVCRKVGHELSWSLVGHSMGSFTATQLAGPLNLRRVVMWASAPAFLDALSQDEQFLTKARVLVIQGSSDKLIELYVKSKEQWREFYARLPRGTVTMTISGGTHGGFGSYTSVVFAEEPIINTSEQHRQAVQWTVRFLRQHSAS